MGQTAGWLIGLGILSNAMMDREVLHRLEKREQMRDSLFAPGPVGAYYGWKATDYEPLAATNLIVCYRYQLDLVEHTIQVEFSDGPYAHHDISASVSPDRRSEISNWQDVFNQHTLHGPVSIYVAAPNQYSVSTGHRYPDNERMVLALRRTSEGWSLTDDGRATHDLGRTEETLRSIIAGTGVRVQDGSLVIELATQSLGEEFCSLLNCLLKIPGDIIPARQGLWLSAECRGSAHDDMPW